MALTLHLLRHAKSDKGGPNLADFDRPLSERGVREAQDMAQLIVERGWQPERILCSSALRTRQTLEPILPLLPSRTGTQFTRRIYDADAETLLDLIREQEDVTSLLLVGHNPGLEDLARALAGSGDGAALIRLRTMFPPASLAVVSFETADWSDVAPGEGRLEAFEASTN